MLLREKKKMMMIKMLRLLQKLLVRLLATTAMLMTNQLMGLCHQEKSETES